MSDVTATIPAQITMHSSEVRSLHCDFATLIGPDEVAINPTAILMNRGRNSPYPAGLTDTPVLDGTVLTQEVGLLQPGQVYRLTLRIQVDSGKTWEQHTDIRCPS